jgi:hypothetical protein
MISQTNALPPGLRILMWFRLARLWAAPVILLILVISVWSRLPPGAGWLLLFAGVVPLALLPFLFASAVKRLMDASTGGGPIPDWVTITRLMFAVGFALVMAVGLWTIHAPTTLYALFLIVFSSGALGGAYIRGRLSTMPASTSAAAMTARARLDFIVGTLVLVSSAAVFVVGIEFIIAHGFGGRG